MLPNTPVLRVVARVLGISVGLAAIGCGADDGSASRASTMSRASLPSGSGLSSTSGALGAQHRYGDYGDGGSGVTTGGKDQPKGEPKPERPTKADLIWGLSPGYDRGGAYRGDHYRWGRYSSVGPGMPTSQPVVHFDPAKLRAYAIVGTPSNSQDERGFLTVTFPIRNATRQTLHLSYSITWSDSEGVVRDRGGPFTETLAPEAKGAITVQSRSIEALNLRMDLTYGSK